MENFQLFSEDIQLVYLLHLLDIYIDIQKSSNFIIYNNNNNNVQQFRQPQLITVQNNNKKIKYLTVRKQILIFELFGTMKG